MKTDKVVKKNKTHDITDDAKLSNAMRALSMSKKAMPSAQPESKPAMSL